MTHPSSDAPQILPRAAIVSRLPGQPPRAPAAAKSPLLYVSGDCEIDVSQRELRIDGSVVPLGSRAFWILEILVQEAGELITKDQLIHRIWPGAAVIPENTLQVHVAAARRALGGYRVLLKTESGRGYRLLGHWTTRHQDPIESPIIHEPVSLTQSPTTNLPAIHRRLVGRAAVLQQLNELMSAYRAVTLTGPGGIGKTALAIEIAHLVHADFADGAWFVELASLSDPDLVPSAVAHTVGLKLGGQRILAENVAQGIGDRQLLLVLDNCEHLIDAAAALAETLVRQCPHTTVLTTSRELLRISGEYVFRVPPLDVPPVGNLAADHLLGHASVALFVSRTQSLGVDVSDADVQGIAAICRRLDGIPLAIEFAASTAAALGVRQVADGLRDSLALLTSGRRTAAARHRTLRATLDWSYELLPEPEQRLLRRLAVFPAGFTLEAAVAVMGDSGDDRASVTDGVANLVAKSLVALDKAEAPTRWRLLETIRAYALEKLAQHGETQEAARSQAAHLRDLFAPLSGFRSRLSTEDLARHGREIDNVRAALDWCFAADGDAAIGIDLTAAYAHVWIDLSLMVECCDRCEGALRSIAPGTSSPTPRLVWLRIVLGSALVTALGPSERSLHVLIEAVEMADALHDPEAQVRALSSLATVHAYRGEYAEAQNVVERLRHVAHRIGDPATVILADRMLGTTLTVAGRPREAQRFLERVVRSSAPNHDERMSNWRHSEHLAMARAMLARALVMQGFADRALAEARASLDDSLATNHPLSLCRTLYYGICRVAPMTGDWPAAEQSTSRLVQTATAVNAPFWVTAGQLLQGKLLVERGEFAQGLTVLRAAFDTCRKTGWHISHQEFQAALAVALAGLGHAREAVEAVDSAIAHAGSRENGRLWYVPELLRIKGEILLQPDLHRPSEEAEICFRQAAEMAADQGALFWELRVALSLARLRAAQGRAGEARQTLAPVYDRFTEGFDTADLRTARAVLDTFPHS